MRPVGPRLLPRLEDGMMALQLVRESAREAGDHDTYQWAEQVRRQIERRRDRRRKVLGLPPVVSGKQAA